MNRGCLFVHPTPRAYARIGLERRWVVETPVDGRSLAMYDAC